MNLTRSFACAFAGIIFLAAGLLAADKQSTNAVAASQAVYVPDTSHANGQLPDGILAWDNDSKAVDAAADQDQAHFTFDFTNISGGQVTILDAHASCGCTTTELPQLPWTIPPGTNGQIGATVNVAGKAGTLFKTVAVTTDKGQKVLNLRINMLPPVVRTMTEAERMHGVAVAKIDRQAVFHGDCASCHVKPGQAKYGKALYDADCGICHEAEHRATMVPDLHTLKTPTNDAFWRTWIAHGKPGSFMPAFSTSDGGPLSDMQIASLAAYLSGAIPSHVAQPAP
jgi:mono/diheme cytochrome c family protein